MASNRHAKLRVLIREELAEIDEQLSELEPQVATLRASRTEVLRMLRLVEPDAAELKPARSSSKSKSNTRIGQARVDRLTDWLREHAGEFPAGFTIPELTGYDDIPTPSKSALTHALPMLVDQGVLRRDGRRNRYPDGSPVHGRKPMIYKLVGS